MGYAMGIKRDETLRQDTKQALTDLAGELVISRACVAVKKNRHEITDREQRKLLLLIGSGVIRAVTEGDAELLEAAINLYQQKQRGKA